MFAYLSWVLWRVNRAVRAQVALKAERSTETLLGVAAVVGAHVPLVLLALRRQDIAGNLVLAGSARPTQVRAWRPGLAAGGWGPCTWRLALLRAAPATHSPAACPPGLPPQLLDTVFAVAVGDATLRFLAVLAKVRGGRGGAAWCCTCTKLPWLLRLVPSIPAGPSWLSPPPPSRLGRRLPSCWRRPQTAPPACAGGATC